MKARVIDYIAGPVSAFGGVEYVAYEWRDVPPGFESQAEQNPYLEVEKPKPKPAPKPEAKPAPKRRRRKTTPKESK